MTTGITAGITADGTLAGGALRARAAAPGAGGLLAAEFRPTPYWWDGLPPAPPLSPEPPREAEICIVGAGYTGLHAALVAARAGRQVLVLDAEAPGWGCSTRNGGQVSTSIKPTLAALTRRHGAERARAIRAEGVAALAWLGEFIAAEGIDCGFARCGRFHAAHSPEAYDALLETVPVLAAEGIPAVPVPRARQAAELGSPAYFGGLVYPDHARVDPARYHRGLLARALEAGAQVAAPCAALSLARRGAGFEVTTAGGPVRAREVVIATNGYSGDLVPWLRRRVIPIGSHIIATEPLAEGVMDRLFPTDRIASDSRRVVYYYRPSPDRRRILFGGRVSARETVPEVSAPRLNAELVRIFPELAGARVTHGWGGTVAYSFDELAHTGVHEGIHYAMGYCGSGVSMASWLGRKLGQRLVGQAAGRSAFEGLPYPTRPLYAGRPWFLPAAVAWYRWRDRMECRSAARRAGTMPAPAG